MNREYIYHCNRKCPINKRCFIIKLAEPLKEPITVLQKCKATKVDIKITVGDDIIRPP